MTKKYVNRYHVRLAIVMLIMCVALTCVCGCSHSTYTSRIGDTTFSFDYSKKDHLYPYSRIFIRRSQPLPPKLSGSINSVALISVDEIEKETTQTHVDIYIAFMRSQEGIVHFGTGERGTITLDGVTAEYVHFSYVSYDTWLLSYSGIFISFIHNGYVVDMDILSASGSPAAYEAFDLFVKTFRIED